MIFSVLSRSIFPNSTCVRAENVYIHNTIKNSDSSIRNVNFLHDSGSTAMLTDSKSVFVPGSVRECEVAIRGVASGMRAEKCGDVLYKITPDVSVLLTDVLYVPSAAIQISGTVNEPTVLVSTR